MAQKLSDGGKVYIPYQGDPTPPSGYAGQGNVAGSVVNPNVNINTGTQAELEALPGIGPVTASKIISGRPYSQINDLLDQNIIGKAVFEKIKGNLVL